MAVVRTTAELIAALAAASPGEVITLEPGTYVVTANLACDRAGTPDAPITVRAETLGTVVLASSAVEGFHVTAPHWTFENLEVRGTCADDSDCEHAFHITGAADGVTLRNNRLVDFNAQVKGNGAPVGAGGAYVWPDDVLVEGNELFDTRARDTSNPVTKLDIVGGRRWRVRANYIHDYQKGGGDGVSYAAFLKGNSRDGVMERNLVVCARAHAGGTRIGLSLGGGGTGPDSICEDGTCSPEHQDGILRNNIIARCSDVGIYLNEGLRSKLYFNTLYATAGIDVRFAASTADVRGNLVTGALRDRDGGTHTEADNVVGAGDAAFQQWFADPDNLDFTLEVPTQVVDLAASVPEVTDDYCGLPRAPGPQDRGAVDYKVARPCDTTVTHPADGAGPGVDGGVPADGGDPPATDGGGAPARGSTRRARTPRRVASAP
ncbi:MAG: PE-PGRS family protein [Deltaproteobacteria bacterium]|nr:PE-PGRS family protein [Kofleriaceae bacterium]